MNYLNAFLKSFSQVFLIENKFFGLIISLSILFVKPRLGIFSILATFLSLIFSLLIKVDKSLIFTGVMGFNSVLIGIACALFISNNKLAFLATLLGVLLALFIQLLGLKYNISLFTLPFVLVALIVFLLTLK